MEEVRTDIKEANYKQEEINKILVPLIPEPMRWLNFKVETSRFHDNTVNVLVKDRFNTDDLFNIPLDGDNIYSFEEYLNLELNNALKNIADDYNIFDAYGGKYIRGCHLNYISNLVNYRGIRKLDDWNSFFDKLLFESECDPLWMDDDGGFVSRFSKDEKLIDIYGDEFSVIKCCVYLICKRNFFRRVYSTKPSELKEIEVSE